MQLLVNMLAEPSAVVGVLLAAMGAAALLLWDVWCDEARIARVRRACEGERSIDGVSPRSFQGRAGPPS